MQDILRNIKNRQDTRQNLIVLKALLKGTEGKKNIAVLCRECDGCFDDFITLLKDEDAKIRKNTALILGELAVPKLLGVLWEAYLEEQTRFVRSAYLEAIRHFDYHDLLPAIKEQLKRVEAIEIDEENRKHVQEEKMLLRELVAGKEERRLHRYAGEGVLSEIVLTTNRNHKHVVFDALEGLRRKEFNAGIMVQTKNPAQLYQLRTFEEMFFLLPGCKVTEPDPAKTAKALAEGGLVDYLCKRHEKSEQPFVFRIEMKGKMTIEQKGNFVRRMAMYLEEATGGRMVNAVSGYDVEIRLIEGKDGHFNVLLKLFTMKDYRFSYRQKNIAAGMKPSNAALAIALAAGETRTDKTGEEKPFLRENALVLDPFCGAGTMLAERGRYGKTKEMYGLDIYADAIEAARHNLELAACRANVVHRDFFTFTSERHFDEIITDMPFCTGEQPEKKKEIEQLYQRFFEHIVKFMSEDGVLLIYSHDRAFIRKYMGVAFKLRKELEISMKEGSYLFLLERNR